MRWDTSTVVQDPSFTISYNDAGQPHSEPVTAEQVERIMVLAERLPDPNVVDDGEDDD